MSSSEEESSVPIKRIKRRKYLCLDNSPLEEVNLYSCKVMPALCSNQRSVLQQMKQKEEIKPRILSKPTIDLFVECSKLSDEEDDEVKIVGEESPIKPLPVTPPPDLVSFSNDRKLEKQKMKLLRNVASVLQKTKQDHLSSLSYTPESKDPDGSSDCVIAKIRFQSSIHKYAMKQTITFHDIFKRLAVIGKTKAENLLLMVNDRRISPEDTPETLDLTVVDFIDAVIMDEQILQESKRDKNNKQNFINVHFQSKFLKQKQTYSVNKFKPFSETMNLYAKLIDFKLKDLCFLFDGEEINGKLTPIELEIDDDYCIDVAKVNKK